jgi:serine phosphatase RsbU (regulator of sigma subunit)
MPLQVLIGVISSMLLVKSGATGATVTMGGLVSVAFTIAGYVFFILFINREGARSLRLQTEIGLAQQIHSHLVPTVSLRTPELEIFAQSIASTEVGGDLVDVVQEGASTGLYVADVSGHGVKAGVFMSMVKSAIRMKLLHKGRLEELCEDLNKVVFQVKQPEMFVTFAAMRFGSGNEASYVLAGHPSILHYQKASRTVVELPNGAPPLGVLEECSFVAGSTSFAAGDLFVLLTDGLIEIVDEWDPDKGLERIKELLVGAAELPVADAHAHIMRQIRARAEVDDDQTLLLARAL